MPNISFKSKRLPRIKNPKFTRIEFKELSEYHFQALKNFEVKMSCFADPDYKVIFIYNGTGFDGDEQKPFEEALRIIIINDKNKLDDAYYRARNFIQYNFEKPYWEFETIEASAK